VYTPIRPPTVRWTRLGDLLGLRAILEMHPERVDS
jgi:hypothetical protein